MALDGSGNVYTVGLFDGTADFDPGAGAADLTTSAGDEGDIFVSKLDSNGNFVWARSMGGTSFDWVISVALDGSGNVYTVGQFYGTADFDPGAGAFNLTSAGGFDIFVSKLDSDGNFVWARSMGGTGFGDSAWGVALDGSGNVYTVGQFYGTADFNPGAGAAGLTSAGGSDIFVSKLDTNGNFVWARSMGGMSFDSAWEVALDGSGNVYTVGQFQGTADFDPAAGAAGLSSAGGRDIFVSKLDTNGNFAWARSMGGTGFHDSAWGVALDGSGNVYTVGQFYDTADFDPAAGAADLTSAGDRDIFVSKLGFERKTPLVTPGGVVNAATFEWGPIAPDSWVSVFGENLGAALVIASTTPLPTSLGGTQVPVTDALGVERLASLQFVAAGQLNFLMPPNTAAGPATVTVTNASGQTSSVAVQVAPVAPGIFSANASGAGPAAATFLRVHPDGSRTEGLTFQPDAPVGSRLNIPIDLDSPDELFLSFFGTGFRFQSSTSVHIGGVAVPILGAVAQGQFDGLDQATLGPLSPTLVGRGEVNAVFIFDGIQANAVTVNIQ